MIKFNSIMVKFTFDIGIGIGIKIDFEDQKRLCYSLFFKNKSPQVKPTNISQHRWWKLWRKCGRACDWCTYSEWNLLSLGFGRWRHHVRITSTWLNGFFTSCVNFAQYNVKRRSSSWSGERKVCPLRSCCHDFTHESIAVMSSRFDGRRCIPVAIRWWDELLKNNSSVSKNLKLWPKWKAFLLGMTKTKIKKWEIVISTFEQNGLDILPFITTIIMRNFWES